MCKAQRMLIEAVEMHRDEIARGEDGGNVLLLLLAFIRGKSHELLLLLSLAS